MDTNTLTIVFIIIGIIIFVLLYMINKLEKRVEMLEYNNDSFMEILYLMQQGAKIDRIEKGDGENAES